MIFKTPCDLMVVDLETNGRDVPDIRITEIGAVSLEKDTLRELQHFSIYVGRSENDPPLSEKSIEITGITNDTLRGWKPFSFAGKLFSEWAYRMGDRFIPTAWGTHFDIPTLRWEYARNGMKFGLPGKSFCIKSAMYNFSWSRGVPIYRCSVQTALRILGLEFEGKEHSALDDARNEARILRVIAGIEKPGPKCMLSHGDLTNTKGGIPISDLGELDEKSPYD